MKEFIGCVLFFLALHFIAFGAHFVVHPREWAHWYVARQHLLEAEAKR